MREILLKDICDLDNGYAFKSSDYIDESNTLNCRMSNIRPDGTFDILYNAKYLPDDYAVKYKSYALKDGDLIIAMTDMANDPKILGVPTVVKTQGYNLLLNQRVGKLRFTKSGVDSKYLKYALQSTKVRNYLKRFAGGGLQINVSKKDILSIPIILRSEEEQNAISELLDRILLIVERQKNELELLDELIKARFVEMFGDTEHNSNDYIQLRLGDVCDLQNGYAFKSGDYVDSSNVNNCRMSNIRPDGGFDSDYSPKYLPDDFWDRYSAYRLYDGDVIIAMTDMASDPKILGVPTIVKSNGKKFLLNQRVGKLVFSDNEQFNRVFLMRFLSQNYIRKNLAKKAGGSTQINVGKPAILDIGILKPPIDSQNQFASFVQQVDKSKVAVQKSLDEAQLLFDSLMQQYFG